MQVFQTNTRVASKFLFCIVFEKSLNTTVSIFAEWRIYFI